MACERFPDHFLPDSNRQLRQKWLVLISQARSLKFKDISNLPGTVDWLSARGLRSAPEPGAPHASPLTQGNTPADFHLWGGFLTVSSGQTPVSLTLSSNIWLLWIEPSFYLPSVGKISLGNSEDSVMNKGCGDRRKEVPRATRVTSGLCGCLVLTVRLARTRLQARSCPGGQALGELVIETHDSIQFFLVVKSLCFRCWSQQYPF